jgi:FkbM family methyltransferase
LLLFDIGANRGDATVVGVALGYDVIAVEPSRVYAELVKNFIYNPKVIPLKYAVSDKDYERVEFYEAQEDGLSTLNKDWLTSPDMPYNGKPFRIIYATTITIDTLAKIYGEPDLIKIDVEGAEWSVFNGMTRKMGMITFEWTWETINSHKEQLKYLTLLGYTEFSIRFIENHLQFPPDDDWLPIDFADLLQGQIEARADAWESHKWKEANLRPTADVGMIWVK